MSLALVTNQIIIPLLISTHNHLVFHIIQHHRGHPPASQIWVFDMVDTSHTPALGYVQVVPQRDAAALLPIIQQHTNQERRYGVTNGQHTTQSPPCQQCPHTARLITPCTSKIPPLVCTQITSKVIGTGLKQRQNQMNEGLSLPSTSLILG